MQDLSTLEGKNIHELREIARVFGIVPSTLKKGELISRIVAAATSEAATMEPEAPVARRGRRPRVSGVKVGGETTAAPPSDITPEPEPIESEPTPEAVAEDVEPVAEQQPAPKRRGRRPKVVVVEEPGVVEEPNEEE